MCDVLQIHITNMVHASSLWSIDFHFFYFASFLILIDIWSQFGEWWAGQDGVSQISWICFVVDADCTYLTYLLLMTKVQLLKMLPCAMISSTVQFLLRKKSFAENSFSCYSIQKFLEQWTQAMRHLWHHDLERTWQAPTILKKGAGSGVVMDAGAGAGLSKQMDKELFNMLEADDLFYFVYHAFQVNLVEFSFSILVKSMMQSTSLANTAVPFSLMTLLLSPPASFYLVVIDGKFSWSCLFIFLFFFPLFYFGI